MFFRLTGLDGVLIRFHFLLKIWEERKTSHCTSERASACPQLRLSRAVTLNKVFELLHFILHPWQGDGIIIWMSAFAKKGNVCISQRWMWGNFSCVEHTLVCVLERVIIAGLFFQFACQLSHPDVNLLQLLGQVVGIVVALLQLFINFCKTKRSVHRLTSWAFWTLAAILGHHGVECGAHLHSCCSHVWSTVSALASGLTEVQK